MAVVIRLARHGAKKNPFYHIVVADSRNARDSGAILERIGSYDPMQPKDSAKRVVFDADKAKAWMARGAKPSDRVYKFLANAGLLAKRAAPVQTKKNQPSEKTKKKIEDRNTKIAKANEAAAAAKAEAEKPAEVPAVDPSAQAHPTESTIPLGPGGAAEAGTPMESVPAETPAESAPLETPAAE